MKALVLLGVPALLCSAATAPDVDGYEQVLRRHVREDGRVDYAAIRKDPAALNRFIAEIAQVSPVSHPSLFPTRPARLAYWINAYNALVLHAFSREYPEKRTRLVGTLGKVNFFYRMKHTVGGKRRTLDDIEDGSIRSEGDPRIHFAIVCASSSCPPLSRQAYRPETLEARLEEEAVRYFRDARNFRLDAAKNEVWLPQILDWFKDDFGGTRERLLAFVAKYRPNESEALRKPGLRIRYIEYDWSPNDVR